MKEIMTYTLGYASLIAMAFTLAYTWTIISKELKSIEKLDKAK